MSARARARTTIVISLTDVLQDILYVVVTVSGLITSHEMSRASTSPSRDTFCGAAVGTV